jgi:hypothetical protein
MSSNDQKTNGEKLLDKVGDGQVTPGLTRMVLAGALTISVIFISIGFCSDNRPDEMSINCTNGGSVTFSGKFNIKGTVLDVCNQLEGKETLNDKL